MPYPHRIAKIQECIQDRGLAGAVLCHSRDIFYYTGTAQPAFLVVRPDEFLLFVRWNEALVRQETGLPADRVILEKSFAAIARRMFPGSGTGEKVGTEIDLIPVALGQEMAAALRDRELVNLSDDILRQRATKDTGEIERIRRACAAVHAGHLAVMQTLRPGITELELAAAVENAQRLADHEGVFFMRMPDFLMSRGPLASGPNLRQTSGTAFTLTGVGLSAAVPAGPSHRTIQFGDLVLVDIPTCVAGYHADQSRTYATEAAPEGARALFVRLRQVADAVLEHLKPGQTAGEAFAVAEDAALKLGLAESFLAFASGARAHFIGHGLGLENNEPPILSRNSRAKLEAGMVLALELHLMEPTGFTMKLEDTILLTPTGPELLTLSPRELTVVVPQDPRY